MKTAIRPKFFRKWEFERWKNKFQKNQKHDYTAFCTCPPSGNQVDGLPLALNPSGRACDPKNYKKMYAVDENFNAELLANHQKVASHYNKVSVEDI